MSDTDSDADSKEESESDSNGDWGEAEFAELRILRKVAADHGRRQAIGRDEFDKHKGQVVVAVEGNLCAWGTLTNTRPPIKENRRVQSSSSMRNGSDWWE